MISSLPVLNCDSCGACCLKQESPPGYLGLLLNPSWREHYPEDAERLRKLPGKLKRELHLYGQQLKGNSGKHPNNGICIWFNQQARRCKHYEHRPEICRDFEVNSEGCHHWRKTFGITEIEAP